MSTGLSQAEIDALLKGESLPGAEPLPDPSTAPDPNAMMTPDEIAAMLAAATGDDAPPAAPTSDPNAIMSPDEIAAMLAAAESAPTADPNAIMSQEEIAAMLASTGVSSTPDPNATMTAEEIASAFSTVHAANNPSDDPNRVMSADEIAALLAGGASDPIATESDSLNQETSKKIKTYDVLSPMEIDAMGEIGNISMGTSATTLFALLNRRVDITTPRVQVTTMADIAQVYPLPFVAVEVKYTTGLQGNNILFLREKDVKIITDLMLGGDGTNINGDLNDMHMSCISEVMNQMMGSASTSLAKMINTAVDISPPVAYSVNLADKSAYPFKDMDETIVRIAFDMVVEGLINSEIMQVVPIPFAKVMVQSLMGGAQTTTTPAQPKANPPQQHAAPPPSKPAQQMPPAATINSPVFQQPDNYTSPFETSYYGMQQPPPQQQQPPPYQQQQPYPPQQGYPPQQPYPPQQGYPPPPPPYQQPYPPQQGYPPPYQQPYPPQQGYPPPPYQQPYPQSAPVDVRNMNYQSFGDSTYGPPSENLDLLMDVALNVAVELGKSKKFIKEIMEFNVGTIIVLDKMAGELVDIVVNGKLIAKGEVVVIDENYGVRITDIVSPSKRLNADK